MVCVCVRERYMLNDIQSMNSMSFAKLVYTNKA